MRIHFIAIGGAVMHNLAIALHKKGYKVSGSDDEIFNPARERLDSYGLLPPSSGWDPDRISGDTDVVILGMHAREDNPELMKARELKLKIQSFPEFLYDQTRDKKRVVIGGSHGKTTITSMVMHVLKENNIRFDYMVGSQLEGFDTMVGLSEDTGIAVFEGDEYLSSALDRRPKFHLYRPHVALLSGIAWDHMNVFPDFPLYLEQFRKFIGLIEPGGSLIYYEKDPEIRKLIEEAVNPIEYISYSGHPHIIKEHTIYLKRGNRTVPVRIFGSHNMQNLNGARLVCKKLGVSDEDFYRSIQSFSGAARRLQLVEKSDRSAVYLDFAHSPSKVKATVEAMKEPYPERKLVALLELHTFSSLNASFLPQYGGTMDHADRAIVYFNPETIKHKKMDPVSAEQVKKAFARQDIQVFTNSSDLKENLVQSEWTDTNLLIMSSGNFDGLDFKGII